MTALQSPEPVRKSPATTRLNPANTDWSTRPWVAFCPLSVYRNLDSMYCLRLRTFHSTRSSLISISTFLYCLLTTLSATFNKITLIYDVIIHDVSRFIDYYVIIYDVSLFIIYNIIIYDVSLFISYIVIIYDVSLFIRYYVIIYDVSLFISYIVIIYDVSLFISYIVIMILGCSSPSTLGHLDNGLALQLL